VLGLGLFLVLQSGCVHRLTIGRYNKVVLYAKNGDKIEFDRYQATFQGPTPCKEGKGPLEKCSIQVDGGVGRFRFTCSSNACSDPEIEVGSSNLKAKIRAPLPKAAPQQPDVIVVVWCNRGTIAIEPPAVDVPAGKTVEFQSDGSPKEMLVHWSLSAADFCETSGTVINDASPYCKVKPAAGGPYTFTVSSTDPTCSPSGPGTVTVR
jgi:hypothetical protein